MGEFFRGWRRKMGVTTLLMALMLMATKDWRIDARDGIGGDGGLGEEPTRY